MESDERQGFEGWCILELMGHRRLAGRVNEATIGGGSFIRIDVPSDDGRPGATQFYAPARSMRSPLRPKTSRAASRPAAEEKP